VALKDLKQFAKRSKLLLIIYMIYENWSAKRRFKSGNIVGSAGVVETKVSDTLRYINRTFDDYLKYSDIPIQGLQDKTVLEIGPGDNLGVALKFLAAGAKRVICIDRYAAKCDPKYERQIYSTLRESLNDSGKQNIDRAINLDNDGIEVNPEKLLYSSGIGIEEAEKVVARESVDFIVSRAAIQHLYDVDIALSVMDRLLRHGGYMIHKIDFRDLGMFSSYGFNPLTFLTISNRVYKLMTYDSGRPNRKLLRYYKQKMNSFGYHAKMLITQVVGRETEVLPHKDSIIFGIDYTSATISCVNEIRPCLADEFKDMTDEQLMVAGIFLSARKP
jgi:SAM-dependent methyltransferase